MNAQQRRQQAKRDKKFRDLLAQMLEELAEVLETHKESPESCAKEIRCMLDGVKENKNEQKVD